MEDLVRLGVGLVLLLVTLSVALSFLAVPMAILRKSGVLRGVRRLVGLAWRGVAGLFRLLTGFRRRRIRRLPRSSLDVGLSRESRRLPPRRPRWGSW